MVCYSSHVLNSELIVCYSNGKKFGNQMSFGYQTVLCYPHCFLTAYKMMSRSSVLAGTSDSKNPDLYYLAIISS